MSIDTYLGVLGLLGTAFGEDIKNYGQRLKFYFKVRIDCIKFSEHIIWSKVRENENLDYQKVVSVCNESFAYKIIECEMIENVYEYDARILYIRNNWIAGTGAKNQDSIELVIEVFDIFKELIISTRKEFVDDSSKFLNSLLERHLMNMLDTMRGDIKEEIRRIDSFAYYIDTVKNPWEQKRESLLDYRSDKVPFVGREAEIQQLFEFCKTNDPIQWWSIIGAGGSGKSRLALEFCQILEGPEWKCVFLDPGVFGKMFDHILKWYYARNLLFVIDYASVIAFDVGKWIRTLSATKLADGQKIRILIIERTGFVGNQSPLWFVQMRQGFCGYGIEEFRYKRELQLTIESLNKEDKRKILKGVILKSGNAVNEIDVSRIVDQLDIIDPDSRRPLYLLFIVQAYLTVPHSDWTRWDRENIQKHIYNREVDRIASKLRDNLIGAAIVQRLWSFATLSGKLLIDREIQSIDCLMCNDDRLTGAGMTVEYLKRVMRDVSSGVDSDILPYEPDIVGEYFLLMSIRSDPQMIQEFLQASWTKNGHYTSNAIFNTYADYGDEDDFASLIGAQDGIMLNFEPEDEKNLVLFCNMLSACAIISTLRISVIFTARIEGILYKRKNLEIARVYSRALLYETTKGGLARTYRNISEMEKLLAVFEDDHDILLNYAFALVNLSENQERPVIEEVVSKIKHLYDAKDVQIAIAYANALVNLSTLQGADENKDTVYEISTIYGNHSDSEDLATVYVNSLFNLCAKQNADEIAKTMNNVKAISDLFVSNFEMAYAYVRILNIYGGLRPDHARRCESEINERKRLFGKEDADAMEATLIIDDLCVNRKDRKEQQTIDRLASLMVGLYNTNIAFDLASAIHWTIVKQDGIRSKVLVQILKDMFQKRARSSRCAYYYADALIKYDSEENDDDLAESVKIVLELAQHFGTEDLAVVYANALFYQTLSENSTTSQNALSELKKFATEKKECRNVVVLYTRAMVNEFLKQNGVSTLEQVNELEMLSQLYPKSKDIGINYSISLYCFARILDLHGVIETVVKLKDLVVQYDGDVDFALSYAKSLLVLYTLQTESDANDTIKLLNELSHLYGHHKGIESIYMTMRGIEQFGSDRRKDILEDGLYGNDGIFHADFIRTHYRKKMKQKRLKFIGQYRWKRGLR